MTVRLSLMATLAQLRARTDEVFPNWSNPLGDDSWYTRGVDRDQDLHSQVAPDLRRFFGAVDEALDAVQHGVVNAGEARGNMRFAEQERERQAATAVRDAQAAYTAAVGRASAALNVITTACSRAGAFQRPSGDVAAQEAQLANLRSDLLLLLAPLSAEDTIKRLGELAQEALANSDELTAWFLAGSPWPATVLESKGRPIPEGQRTSFIASALTNDGSKVRAKGRRGLALAEEGPHAMRRVVETWLPAVLEDELTRPEQRYADSARRASMGVRV